MEEKRTRTPESLRALGDSITQLTRAEQADFLHGFMAGHDRLAHQIHQQTRGQEDGRPVWYDKMARMLMEVCRHLEAYPQTKKVAE